MSIVGYILVLLLSVFLMTIGKNMYGPLGFILYFVGLLCGIVLSSLIVYYWWKLGPLDTALLGAGPYILCLCDSDTSA